MKKIIALLLVLVMALGLFAGCDQEPNPGTTAGSGIEDAKTLLWEMYKDAATSVGRPFERVSQVMINSVKYPVTWSVNVDKELAEVVPGDSMTTIKVNITLEEAAPFTLTATISDADGKTVTLDFPMEVSEALMLPAIDAPVVGTPYKFGMIQVKALKTVYLDGGVSGRYLTSTEDKASTPNFYIEEAEGGYKIYFEKDGKKNYIEVYANDEGKDSLRYSENGSVFTYDKNTCSWQTTFNDTAKYIGSYNTYETMSISNSTYIKASNTGVEQFPGGFFPETGEDAKPQKPADDPNDDPVDDPVDTLTALKDFIAIADAQPDKGDATAEKYLVKGTITEIANDQYGNVYIEDGEGNKLYIYGLWDATGKTRFDAMDPQPKVGDVITVLGVACKYNNPQMKNGWVQKIESADGLTSITDFNAIASAQPDKGDATADKYTVSGTVTEIVNDKYGNVYIKDAEGNQLYIYGLWNATGEIRFDAMDPQPKVGDVITVVGVASNYNGPQMKNGWVLSIEAGTDTPVTPGENPTYLTSAPEAGKSYKLGLEQTGLGKNLYFTGNIYKTYPWYMDTTENFADAIEVTVEAVEGGYRLFFTKDGTKTYLDAHIDGTHFSLRMIAEPTAVWTWNAEHNTFVVDLDGTACFIGTSGTFTSLSCNKLEQVASSFVAHLYN